MHRNFLLSMPLVITSLVVYAKNKSDAKRTTTSLASFKCRIINLMNGHYGQSCRVGVRAAIRNKQSFIYLLGGSIQDTSVQLRRTKYLCTRSHIFMLPVSLNCPLSLFNKFVTTQSVPFQCTPRRRGHVAFLALTRVPRSSVGSMRR